MNYASIRTCDIANGEGVRVTLFVSGCTHRCKGCFNPDQWDFDYGKPFDRQVEDEILIVKDDNGKLIWKCPKCGNTDEAKLYVARRTCGYIGSQFWNQGRTQEIKERVLHVS